MKANQLATMVLRLLGVYCLIQIIPTLIELGDLFFIEGKMNHSDNSIFQTFIPASIPSICWLVTTTLLFLFSGPLGEKLGRGINEEKTTEISFEQIQILAFAIVGVFLLVEGLSQLCVNIYAALTSLKHFNKDQYPGGMDFIDWRAVLSAVGVILKTAIGAWMFFGARGFANLWHSLRNFGTPKPPEN
jgi:hypothetical protein